MSAEHEYAGPKLSRTNLSPYGLERRMLIGLFFDPFKQLQVERRGYTTSNNIALSKGYNKRLIALCDCVEFARIIYDVR